MARKTLIILILSLHFTVTAYSLTAKTYVDSSWQTIDQKVYTNGVWQSTTPATNVLGGNLIFSDYFTDLSNWNSVGTGGTVDIVTERMHMVAASDAYPEMEKTFDVGSSANWIVEFDYQFAGATTIEITDAVGTMRASLTFASNTISFSTDLASTPQTRLFTAGRPYQIILSYDARTETISCYATNFAVSNYPAQQIGSAKELTPGTSYALRFKSNEGYTTNISYVSECRIYNPQMLAIGDSVCQGIFLWENAPDGIVERTDRTGPFTYQAAQMYNDCWIGNRAFGGSTLSEMVSNIDNLLEQNPTKVFFSCGHNDIMNSVALATMQANFNTCLTAIQAAGIAGDNIIIGNCIPSLYLDTATERTKRNDYNAWLELRAAEEGFLLLDQYSIMANPETPDLPLYPDLCINDLTHPNMAGYAAIAQGLFNLLEGL